VNISDPAAVDPKMTANLLQEHGITATGSLVCFACFGMPCAIQNNAHLLPSELRLEAMSKPCYSWGSSRPGSAM